MNSLIRVEVHSGTGDAVEYNLDDGCTIPDLLSSLATEDDVSIALEPEGGVGKLLIAISKANAFLGLEVADGVYQYRSGHSGPPTQFIIGEQESDIPASYVVSVPKAAQVASNWLANPNATLEGWDKM